MLLDMFLLMIHECSTNFLTKFLTKHLLNFRQSRNQLKFVLHKQDKDPRAIWNSLIRQALFYFSMCDSHM